jgi:uncharacterized protein YyaL (SSP411 family)
MRSISLSLLLAGVLACVVERGPLTNQMGRSGTRYLARAAREPISWQSWSREVFTLAARLDRPILLYVGADDCRWCAAMDRETYADASLGVLIDSLFVPVRVDRDEHPEVAQRYQVAVQLLTGLRGYPLTVFLTPDGSAFFGGTYFPADDPLTGRGMRQLLPEVARSYRQQRTFVLRQAALVRQLALAREGGTHGVLESRAVAVGIQRVRRELEEALRARTPLGGFMYGQAAALLLTSATQAGDTADVSVVRRVLDFIADSGEAVAAMSDRDDPPGVVRAGMLRNLAVGWVLTGEPRYRDAARRIVGSLTPELVRTSDRVVFADRDAYVIGAVLTASAALGDSTAERHGLAALDELLAGAYVSGRGVRHSVRSDGPVGALLQDQVQVAGACLVAFNATGEPRYLAAARDLAAILDRDFADPMGGYFDATRTDPAVPALSDRTKQVWDDLLPGANAWAAGVLLQLANVTGESRYRRRAEATLEAFAGVAPRDQVRASSYLTAAHAVLPLR